MSPSETFCRITKQRLLSLAVTLRNPRRGQGADVTLHPTAPEGECNNAPESERRKYMKRSTVPVSDSTFRQVYDSPASLPGRHKWLTPTDEVREIERSLGMPSKTIGAPLWVSGDRKRCPKCRRETTWLDIVASALGEVHTADMIAQVILGEQKFVNTEAPNAIKGLKCFQCKTAIDNLRSFKCHNWAYAKPALLDVIEKMHAAGRKK